MNVRTLLLSGALVAMMGFAACNENPIDTPPANDAPTNLKATSMSGAVGLSWSAVSGATAYNVTWSTGGIALGTIGTGTTTAATVSGLTNGMTYTFSVKSATGTDSSTIIWAPSARFDNTTAGVTDKIRMYEFKSTQESGVNLFTGSGPINVSMKPNTAGKAQLAMFVGPKDGPNGVVDSIIIGPAYAIVEYRAAAASDLAKIDQTVFISGSTTLITSLDSWFLTGSLEALIDQASNGKAYKFTTGAQAQSHGFIVRIGAAGARNYARVMVKSIGGQMLQGVYPNRYVELEVSYQTQLNVPYAKGTPSTGGVRATGGH